LLAVLAIATELIIDIIYGLS